MRVSRSTCDRCFRRPTRCLLTTIRLRWNASHDPTYSLVDDLNSFKSCRATLSGSRCHSSCLCRATLSGSPSGEAESLALRLKVHDYPDPERVAVGSA